MTAENGSNLQVTERTVGDAQKRSTKRTTPTNPYSIKSISTQLGVDSHTTTLSCVTSEYLNIKESK